ncbi:uncharacterized protein LOC144164042 [Haemaphysalis longicornis]
MAKFRARRARKRKFAGNQHTPKKLSSNAVDAGVSATAKKRGVIAKADEAPLEDSTLQGNRVEDISILSGVFSSLACSEYLKTSLKLEERSKRGICSTCAVVCTDCGFELVFDTSRRVAHANENNFRLVYAMHQLGKGRAGAETFSKVVNMPAPSRHSAYDNISSRLSAAAREEASKSMIDAAAEVRSVAGRAACGVSGDGTWQKRGHSSLNGCVSVISVDTGKVVDVEALSSSCKSCRTKSKLNLQSSEYQKWTANHTSCQANHEESAGTMETVGLYRIFERSETTRSLRYLQYHGNEDTKSHLTVKDMYGKNSVQKLECTGHVQKRVGCRLRKLKKTVRGLGGKGNITDALTDRLQNYYGIAIRANVGNLSAMKQATLASLFHCSSTDKDPRHGLCPLGPQSCCVYRRVEALGQEKYVHKGGLPNDVLNTVKTVYNNLCSDELLMKCLHGKTQNANECFNGLIWQRAPKGVYTLMYVTLPTLLFAWNDAVANFNNGSVSTLEVLRKAGIEPGYYTTKACITRDQQRIQNAQRTPTEGTKQARKKRRAATRAKGDSNASGKRPSYEPGAF